MGDSAFSLPTLMVIVPAAGGLIAMSMVTRRAAAITSLLTFLLQSALIAIGAVQLHRYAEAADGNPLPSCAAPVAREHSQIVLAQCSHWFPKWGIEYHVALGWAALGLIAVTTLVTAAATSFTWWADRERPAPMHGLMWLSAASLVGLFVARDLVLFYVFFELMLLPMLVLVGVWGGEGRVRATMTMFLYTFVGSLPMLVGIIGAGLATSDALHAAGGDSTKLASFSLTTMSSLVGSGDLHLSSWILASFLLAFAIKGPLAPFHGWLPTAYREAPAEVTAMLSGIISKAAYFGLFAIVLPLFPTQLAGGWGTGLAWVALASLLYGSLAAFRQPDPRGVVAYSSLAQMGLIVLGLTAFVGGGEAQGLGGAYLQTINHALVSTALFLFVGIIEIRSGERTFARMGALATGRARLASIGLVLALIALAVPGATTFAGELLILAGVFRGDVGGPLVAALASTAVILAAMYALRLVAGIAFTSDDDVATEGAAATKRFGGDLGGRELLVLGPVVIALLVLSAWPNLLHRGMQQPPVPVQASTDPVAKLQASPPAADDTSESTHDSSERAQENGE